MNPPPRIGPWAVGRPLGEGGAASVFCAEGPGGRVAVKFFPRIQASAEEFRREAAALGRNRHPNLVRLVDAGLTDDGSPWLALEFVDGPDLRTRLDEGPPVAGEAVGLMIQVFAALDALHRSGVAHGDIKPENVIVQGSVARVVDFGRARLRHLLGGTGVFPGTPPYMHPSLFRGGAPDARTDCFAAWIMVHELVAGERPFTSGALRAGEGDLPPRIRLADRRLDALVEAGLSGRLPDARSAWLALVRHQGGQEGLPVVRPPPPPPPPGLVDELRKRILRGRSVCLVGDPDVTRTTLEALHRAWTQASGNTLWVRPEPSGAPLGAALGLAAEAAETFDGVQLAAVAEALGPLAGPLASAAPATRAWLHGGGVVADRPEAEQLRVALARFVFACPRPLVLLVDGIDRVDGSTRRFLAGLATTDEAVVVASARPGGPHGLAESVGVAGSPAEPDEPPTPLPVATGTLLAVARLLDLPFGPLLARAVGLPVAFVEEAGLLCEAAGEARWTGSEVVARPGPTLAVAEAQRVFRDAAARLDLHADALLVARYARLGGDADRLAGVIETAVDVALRVDPAVALDLLDQDPRPRDARRQLRHVQVALLARDLGRAQSLQRELALMPGVSAADVAEAEAEVAFRTGQTVPALSAYRRVAAALGRPVRAGLLGIVLDLVALWRVFRDRPAAPRPDERLGRVFERLHDLQFNEDNAPMLRIHARWKEAAPENRRARAMDLVWSVALGLEARARRIEAELSGDLAEEGDPVGAAIVLAHRAIARLWKGDVVEAHQDAVDAAERLLRAGDPYQAALACTTAATTTFHLGHPAVLARLVDELGRLVTVTGDARAAAWAAGCHGIVAWTGGRPGEAVRATRTWADAAAARGESTEAFARRFLADLLLDQDDLAGATEAIGVCRAVVGRYHLRMDYIDAIVLTARVAGARAAGAGASTAPFRFATAARAAGLVRRSPRWGPRAAAAEGWVAAGDGRRSDAAARFGEALAEAERRRQYQDAWWILTQRARALADGEADAAATLLARRHGLGMGVR